MKRAWYILTAAFLVGGFAPNAEALLLAIEAVWTTDPSPVQNGSIVQVVVVRSGQNAPISTTAAGEHFQPYGDSFIPDTVVASGNELVYTGTVIERGANDYYFSAFVEVPSIYDKVYLRVFNETGWEQGTPKESTWGISDVHAITDDGAGMGFTWWGNIALPNSDSFEVIPEPGTMALLGVGAVGLAGWLRRRKGEKREQTGKTGAEEP